MALFGIGTYYIFSWPFSTTILGQFSLYRSKEECHPFKLLSITDIHKQCLASVNSAHYIIRSGHMNNSRLIPLPNVRFRWREQFFWKCRRTSPSFLYSPFYLISQRDQTDRMIVFARPLGFILFRLLGVYFVVAHRVTFSVKTTTFTKACEACKIIYLFKYRRRSWTMLIRLFLANSQSWTNFRTLVMRQKSKKRI